MPVVSSNDLTFTGSRNGPDNVARAKTSWQAALRRQAKEDLAELQTVRWLLKEGCPPPCQACRIGVHEDDPCRCCGHTDE